jgi:site-specific DNA-cytosine methylase
MNVLIRSGKMKVLSLFDGMGCGFLALKKCGIKIDNYFASEIEPNAIRVATTNNPDIIEIGDVSQIFYKSNSFPTFIANPRTRSRRVAINKRS